MTNATIQKVCYLTLNSTSGTHRHTLGGGGRGHHPTWGYCLWHLQHTGFSTSVNLIDHVSLEEGYVFMGMGGFGCWGI